MSSIPAFVLRMASLFVCMVPLARAHSDPWGDIHPKVTVLEGNFSIVFNTSLPDQVSNYLEEKAVYRTIYSPEGKMVTPRHSLERKRHWSESGSLGIHGGSLRLGEETLIFKGDQEQKPGYLLRSADGKVSPVALPWPKEVSLDLFEDVVVTAEGIGITGKEDETELKFYWFPFGSAAAPTILNLGPTACIYNFPVASNPVFAGGKFHVAFMRNNGKGEEAETLLHLWSWKPGDKEAKVEVLDSPGFWNSHLSMAAIGERLCLAYHCETFNPPGARLANIVTVFRKAE
jgi:hypothetical protein